jgi:hypothetical protein
MPTREMEATAQDGITGQDHSKGKGFFCCVDFIFLSTSASALAAVHS